MITKAIQQSVRFNASPEKLLNTYLDSKKHSAATGGKARMSCKVAAHSWHGTDSFADRTR